MNHYEPWLTIIWLVVWNINFIFPYIGFLIIPIDELIFFRGVAQPPTRWPPWCFLHLSEFLSLFVPSLATAAGWLGRQRGEERGGAAERMDLGTLWDHQCPGAQSWIQSGPTLRTPWKITSFYWVKIHRCKDLGVLHGYFFVWIKQWHKPMGLWCNGSYFHGSYRKWFMKSVRWFSYSNRMVMFNLSELMGIFHGDRMGWHHGQSWLVNIHSTWCLGIVGIVQCHLHHPAVMGGWVVSMASLYPPWGDKNDRLWKRVLWLRWTEMNHWYNVGPQR